MSDCLRDGCPNPAHPIDHYCSRLCCEVHNGLADISAIAEHAKWLRNHRAGGQPKSTSSVKANIANARTQGASAWAGSE